MHTETHVHTDTHTAFLSLSPEKHRWDLAPLPPRLAGSSARWQGEENQSCSPPSQALLTTQLWP